MEEMHILIVTESKYTVQYLVFVFLPCPDDPFSFDLLETCFRFDVLMQLRTRSWLAMHTS